MWLTAPNALAACSGSGVTWSCTAGTTVAQVNTALASAASGATLTFAAGSYTWGGAIGFSNTKGVTLICESAGSCAVASSGMAMGLQGTLSGTNTNLYRISGFVFSGGETGMIWFYGSGSPTLTRFRIDHNTFQNQTTESSIILFGDNGSCNAIYGLLDNNIVTNSGSIAIAEGYTSASCTPTTGQRGTANNIYFENNTITVATMTNAGKGCVDWQGGHAWVWRYNTTTNCLVTSHGVTHGWGPVNGELYGNTFIATSGMDPNHQDGYRFFHHQGSGLFLAWGNILRPLSGSGDHAMISMMHYRSTGSGSGYAMCDGTVSIDGNRTPTATYKGYPCYRQPGRDTAATLHPLYSWLNRRSDGGLVNITCEAFGETCTKHIVANRDLYSAVSANAQTSTSSPFNGTTGMGYGTLANRPTTCTTGPEAADAGKGGVGYWATDDGEWDDTRAGPDGRLYRCSATNTWIVGYTPYRYPHPLRSAPARPTGLRIVR